MPDDIEYITFQNDKLQTTPEYVNGVLQPQYTTYLNGTIKVDYTTGTYQTVGMGFTFSGDENGSVGGSGPVTTDSNGYVINNGGNFTTPEVQFRYQTETPGSATSITYNAPDGRTYNSNSSAAPVSSSTTAPTCFTTGTAIATDIGLVAVEDLAVGDLVLTVSGTHRPIRWIGHREIENASHSEMPIRVAADAFGAGLPERDLWLSPGHPVLVGADADGAGGHLVPIMCFVNGTTIERMAVDSVTYWHIELDAHDILLAEGLPAESYLDWGDRAFFSEGADHALANPDFVVPGLAGRCRPVAVDGPVVEAERRRLDAVFATQLAGACAWPGEELALA